MSLATIFFLPLDAADLKKEIHFEQITESEGLLYSMVWSLYQDRLGFIWIGTSHGVNRYDGHEFISFTDTLIDSDIPRFTNTTCFFEDTSGHLWTGGDKCGLNRYNRETHQFTAYRHDPENSNSLIHDHVTAVMADASGLVWIGTRGGVDCLNPFTLQFTHYTHDPQKFGGLSHNNVKAIGKTSDGRIWIATYGGGLNAIDPETGTVQVYCGGGSKPAGLQCDYLHALIVDENDELWLGSFGGGLIHFDPATERFTYYMHEPGNAASISSNRVRALLLDRSGQLWVGTYGGGLCLFNRSTGRFTAYRHEPDTDYSLGDDVVLSLLEDASGMIWAGLYNHGISTFDPVFQRFYQIRAGSKQATLLSASNVQAIVQKNNRIYVGLFGHGVDVLNQSLQKIDHFNVQSKDNPDKIGNLVSCMIPGNDETLWIGTGDQGVARYFLRTGHIDWYQHEPGSSGGLSNNNVQSLLLTRDRLLWIGTWSGGLNVLNPETGEMISYQADSENPDALGNNVILSLLEDKAGDVWIATEGELAVLHRQTGKFEKIPELMQCTVLFQDSSGYLWIGANMQLYRMHIEERQLQKMAVFEKSIRNIMMDDAGIVWVNTDNGIARLPKEAESLRLFTDRDGIDNNLFKTGTVIKHRSGAFLLGGRNGITWFHPDEMGENPYQIPVFLTSFRLHNRIIQPGMYPLKKSITLTQNLKLSWRDSRLSFRFAGLHYYNHDNIQYAYQMGGFDRNWIDVDAGDQNAHYTNLDPGHYVFRVKAANSDGVWNPSPCALAIEITPPFWQRHWFRFCMVLTAFLLVYLIIRFRMRQIQKHNETLTRLVDEKTRALRERTLALKRSNQDLEQFAYIASHDLQEPLRKVRAFGGRLEKKYQPVLDGKGADYLQRMLNSTERMQVLIDNLLAYSRVSTKARPFVDVDLNQILCLVVSDLESRIMDTEGVVHVDALPTVIGDPVQLRQLFQNLVGNALKFQKAGNKPVVKVFADQTLQSWNGMPLPDIQHGLSRILIEDNGIGIEKSYQEQVFQVFQRLHGRSEYEGTGIGLAICRKIVSQHDGSLNLFSIPDSGTVFVVQLALANHDAQGKITDESERIKDNET